VKEMKKVRCPGCDRQVDTTRFGKYAPHNDGNVRCGWSGSRVIEFDNKENKNGRL
jgi:endogenous inhibitor of DNA gyrase (YacG/DUF329 family)